MNTATPTQWPKFHVRSLNADKSGYETRIMERAEAEALHLEVTLTSLGEAYIKYATPENTKTTFDQLASGSIAGCEPLGSDTHFKLYTLEDSIRDAASELLAACKAARAALLAFHEADGSKVAAQLDAAIAQAEGGK